MLAGGGTADSDEVIGLPGVLVALLRDDCVWMGTADVTIGLDPVTVDGADPVMPR